MFASAVLEAVAGVDGMVVGSITVAARWACRSLEEKAREYNITDLPAFYSSRDFRNNGFMLERDAGRIVLTDG